MTTQRPCPKCSTPSLFYVRWKTVTYEADGQPSKFDNWHWCGNYETEEAAYADSMRARMNDQPDIDWEVVEHHCLPERHYHACPLCLLTPLTAWCTAGCKPQPSTGQYAPMMCEICREHPQYRRVETGALQIDDDWPGTFIRGDNAAYYAINLCRLRDSLVENSPSLALQDTMALSALNGIIDLLSGSRVWQGKDPEGLHKIVREKSSLT